MYNVTTNYGNRIRDAIYRKLNTIADITKGKEKTCKTNLFDKKP